MDNTNSLMQLMQLLGGDTSQNALLGSNSGQPQTLGGDSSDTALLDRLKKMMILKQLMGAQQQQGMLKAPGGMSSAQYPALGLQQPQQSSSMNPLAMMLMAQGGNNQLMNNSY